MRALLFSGGIDSTALAWATRPDLLLFVDYGQAAAKGEERASRAVADALGLRLDVVRVDLSALGRGSMAGSDALPGAPPENWPFRNQMLVTLAAMTYAGLDVSEIALGTVVTDRLHPDGRPEFMAAIDEVVRVQSGVRVTMPARDVSTDELVATSGVHRSILGWTFSCHTGEWACGQCRGCRKHDDVMATVDHGPSVGTAFPRGGVT